MERKIVAIDSSLLLNVDKMFGIVVCVCKIHIER